MKKNLFLVCALMSSFVATAQSSKPAPNAVLLSETRTGNTVTSRYLIPHKDGKHAEFDVYYTINRSDIVPAYSNNKEQMNELKDFLAQVADTTMHISAIHIVGYASPDGNGAQNDSLAAHRASSLYRYAVNSCCCPQKVDVEHHTYHWSDVAKAVNTSNIPDKQAVLQVLQSTTHSEQQKEAALRKMAAAWNFLTNNILPTMRYADIEFDYGVDEVVTRTTLVSQPKPAPQPAPQPTTQPAQKQPELVVVDEEMGIIVATPKSDAEQRKACRKEMREDKKSKKSKKK